MKPSSRPRTRIVVLAPVAALTLFAFSCLNAPAGAQTESVAAELERLYQADQDDREGGVRGEALQERDTARRQRVGELLAADLIVTPDARYHAEMLSTPSPAARDLLKAHALASAAAFAGHQKARWLAAASLDRFLEYTKQGQFFGTQFERDEAGRWQPGSVDDALVPSLRQSYELPSQEEQQRRADSFNR